MGRNQHSKDRLFVTATEVTTSINLNIVLYSSIILILIYYIDINNACVPIRYYRVPNSYAFDSIEYTDVAIDRNHANNWKVDWLLSPILLRITANLWCIAAV